MKNVKNNFKRTGIYSSKAITFSMKMNEFLGVEGLLGETQHNTCYRFNAL